MLTQTVTQRDGLMTTTAPTQMLPGIGVTFGFHAPTLTPRAQHGRRIKYFLLAQKKNPPVYWRVLLLAKESCSNNAHILNRILYSRLIAGQFCKRLYLPHAA